MPLPNTLVGIVTMVILVGYISSYAFFPSLANMPTTIQTYEKDIAGSLNNATASQNPIYTVIAVGTSTYTTFLLAAGAMGAFLAVYLTELPADFYILSVILTIGLVFAVFRYIRGMWDR